MDTIAEMHSLSGRVAIVTGSSSGIGSGIALELARHGAAVGVSYSHSKSGADEVVAAVRDLGGRAIAVQADVGSEADVQRLFRTVKEEFGTVHILVNNSGIQKDAPLVEMSLADWESVIRVNLTGQFLCSREAAKEFIARGTPPERSPALGTIICISSVHEVIPWAGHVNYAASKGGVMQLMKSMAQELAPQRIRVNTVAPGAIRTRINRDAWETEEARTRLLQLIPYGRIGEVNDIGKAVAWLASDASDYVHGATLFVDGGMTLYPEFARGG